MRNISDIFIVFSIVAFFLSAPNAFCAGEVKDYQIQSKILSDAGLAGKRALSVYLPEDYNTSKSSYPVLYLIHGTFGNNLTFFGGGYDGRMSDANVSVILERRIKAGKIKPLLVVCPNVSGIVHYDEYLLRDVIPFVDSTFRTIPNRQSRAIAGHSEGAFDSLYLALSHPEVFSIAGGLSSYRLWSLKIQLGEFLKAQVQELQPTRFWLYAGTNDDYVIPEASRDFVKTLRENQLPAVYSEDEGDHESNVAQRLGEFIEYLVDFLKW